MSKGSDAASLKPKHTHVGWVRGGKKGHYSAPGGAIKGGKKK
jgi:hypothetical protein